MSDTIETEETDTLIASNKVEGTAVYDPDGERLGSIQTLMIEKISGQVEYAVLQFGGLFGLGSDYYPLPWQKLRYDEDEGGYVVDVDKAMLERAPKYAADAEPTFDRGYGDTVYGYYGVTNPIA